MYNRIPSVRPNHIIAVPQDMSILPRKLNGNFLAVLADEGCLGSGFPHADLLDETFLAVPLEDFVLGIKFPITPSQTASFPMPIIVRLFHGPSPKAFREFLR